MIFDVLLVVVVLSFLGRFVHSAWQGGSERAFPAEAELGRLREEVDQLNAQVRRLAEEQSFMVSLLSAPDRARLEAGAPPPQDSPTGDG
ncbi:MAG TPA: hypothetical protein VFE05_23165 [Longimicrobiaceae bacterium]|jgi:hypothetical protein|nr:hypothetical protein [Longimicrobiaceae bacterium]